MVTAHPPATGPEFGVAPVTVGGPPVRYVHPAVNIACWPSGLVTVTSTDPGLVPGGTIADNAVGETSDTPVAFANPNRTVAPVWKLAPSMLTLLPPPRGPLLGVTLWIVGASWGVTVTVTLAVDSAPAALVTLSSQVVVVVGEKVLAAPLDIGAHVTLSALTTPVPPV